MLAHIYGAALPAIVNTQRKSNAQPLLQFRALRGRFAVDVHSCVPGVATVWPDEPEASVLEPFFDDTGRHRLPSRVWPGPAAVTAAAAAVHPLDKMPDLSSEALHHEVREA